MVDKTYEYFSSERKRLQSIGKAPKWLTTAGFQLLSEKNYLLNNETPLDMYNRVASKAAELVPDTIDITLFNDNTGITNWKDLFFRDMLNGWLSPSTTVLTNLGTEKGHPVSCSGTYLDDSIDGFYRARHEIAILTKLGYGTSWDLTPVRSRGSKFGLDGEATGVTQPMEGARQDTKEVSQGTTRRGSIGQYLNVMHRDFDEVNNELRADDAGLNIGWVFDEEYKKLVKSNPTRADEIWTKILKTKMQTGKGYFFWKDKVNARRPKMYRDKGFYVTASNLCVTGDTKILTKKYGYIEIEQVAGKTLECWNGVEWSRTQIELTNQGTTDIWTVVVYSRELDKDIIIKCSGYHKWYNRVKEEFRTNTLSVGMLLEEYIDPDTHTKKRDFVIKDIIKPTGNDFLPLYCGHEPKRNKLIFNGVLTGNCLEINLFSDKDHTFSCVLSTVNAYRYDEWKDTKLVQRSMIFLDAVIDDMLIKAKQDKSGMLEHIIRFTENTRAVGLGVQGNTSYMQKHRMVYGGMESRQFEARLFKHLDEESMKASKYLAKVVGEPEYMKGYGERFSHRLTLPPTMSTSIIMGGYNEGCMPVFSNVFTQDTAGGNVFRINPVFLELMKERSMYTEEVMQRIVKANGSVQEEDWLTDHEKQVFLTAFELNQYTVLSMAAERQKRVDQGQSINLCIDDSTTEEEISDLHLYAEQDPNILGLYYIRSLNGLAKHKSTDECVACQG